MEQRKRRKGPNSIKKARARSAKGDEVVVTARLTPDLHSKFVDKVEGDRRSINQTLIILIEDYVSRSPRMKA